MPADTLLNPSGTPGRASACKYVRKTSGNVLLAVPLRHNGSPIERIRLFYLWPFFMTIGLALWRDCPLMAVGDHTSVRMSAASTGRASARGPSLAHSRSSAPSRTLKTPTSSTPPHRRGPAIPQARRVTSRGSALKASSSQLRLQPTGPRGRILGVLPLKRRHRTWKRLPPQLGTSHQVEDVSVVAGILPIQVDLLLNGVQHLHSLRVSGVPCPKRSHPLLKGRAVRVPPG